MEWNGVLFKKNRKKEEESRESRERRRGKRRNWKEFIVNEFYSRRPLLGVAGFFGPGEAEVVEACD
jgi:hypothetical protein